MRMNIISALALLTFGTLALAEEEECWSLAEGYPCCEKETTKIAYVTEHRGALFGVENGDWCGIVDLQLDYMAAHPTTSAEKTSTTKTVLATSMDSTDGCWSLVEGYPCCTIKTTKTKYTSDTRNVEYGIEDGQWCGITELQLKYRKYMEAVNCWSLISDGNPCCEKETTTVVYVTEGRGAKFGLENGDWCGITELQENYMAAQEGKEVPQCAGALQMCGGSLFPDAPTCCQAGSFCWHYSDEWHECVPNEFKSTIEAKYMNA